MSGTINHNGTGNGKVVKHRKPRSDASVRRIIEKIEAQHSLPCGCITFVRPWGTRFHPDDKIEAVRNAWRGIAVPIKPE